VGQDSYKLVAVSDQLINRLERGATDSDLFGNNALEEIKSKTTTGIKKSS